MWNALLRHAPGGRECGRGDGATERLRQGQTLVDPTTLGPGCRGFPGYRGTEIPREDNGADLLTHPCSTKVLETHLARLCLERRPAHLGVLAEGGGSTRPSSALVMYVYLYLYLFFGLYFYYIISYTIILYQFIHGDICIHVFLYVPTFT